MRVCVPPALARVEATRLAPRTVTTAVTAPLAGHASVRARLVRVVEEDPGIHPRALQRVLGVGWGQVAHHVMALAREGALRLERRGRYVHVFVPGRRVPREGMLLGAARDIFALVPESGGVTRAELQARLGLSRQLVAYHLRKLDERGLVTRAGARFVRA